MGFVNVELTEEEQIAFKNKKIKNPRKWGFLEPTHMTIDYDNDIWMVRCYMDRESEEGHVLKL